MISFNGVWLISIVSFVIITILLIVFGILSFKKEYNTAYSFLQHFPNEMNHSKKYLAFMLIYSAFYLSILWNTMPFIYNFGSFVVLTVVEAVCGLVIAGSFIMINLLEPKFVKQHTMFSTVYMVVTFMFAAIGATYSFLLYSINKGLIQFICGIILTFIALLQLVVVFNPKLKDWARLDSKATTDGTIEFSRPKIFPLAYSEWITFVVSTLSLILFLIALVK